MFATERGRAFGLSLAFTALWTVLWLAAVHREDSWRREPTIDAGAFHCTALRLERALRDEGLGGFARTWAESDPVHAPLVPAASALLLLVFGESRPVAELVLPLSTLLLVYSCLRIFGRLFDRKTAVATTALALAFPVSLINGRHYFFEHPESALFAAACAALLDTEGFSRTGASVRFGVLAGLTSLSRMGAPVLLVGPPLVVLAAFRREPQSLLRLGRAAGAAAIAVALAATWYLPNLSTALAYVRMATGSPDAILYAPFGGGDLVASALYSLRWIVQEGPGVPMALLAAAAALWGRFRSLRSPVVVALLVAFAIDFLLLLPATQMVRARYFLPLMPIVALLVVRAVNGRPLFALGVGACALHHVVALTFTFPVPLPDISDESIGNRSLWYHRTVFLDQGKSTVDVGGEADRKTGEIVDRIAAGSFRSPPCVFVLSDHALLQINSVRYEAILRRLDWDFGIAPALMQCYVTWPPARVVDVFRKADVLVVLESPENNSRFPAWAGNYARVVAALNRRAHPPFEEWGDPIPTAPGSLVRLWRRGPRLEVRRDPVELPAAAARFEDADSGSVVELVGAALQEATDVPPTRSVTLCFRSERRLAKLPTLFFLVPPESGKLESPRIEGFEDATEGPFHFVYRAELATSGPREGIGFGLLASPERRWRVASSSRPVLHDSVVLLTPW